MKLRLFIAINLPADLKNKIAQTLENLKTRLRLPVRFLGPTNWHLTISFLGYQEESALTSILEATKKTAGECVAPLIEFESLDYGPRPSERKNSGARMIWINTRATTSKGLSVLKATLEDNLIAQRVRFKKENRFFQGHLTLARFASAALTELPQLTQPFTYKFTAKTLDLMESRLYRLGAEYSLLSSFDFRA